MKEKLVRDKLPEICAKTPGKTPMKYRIGRPEEFALFASAKLIEEANELCRAIFDDLGRKDGADILEEIADIQEVLDVIRRKGGWSAADVKNVQIRKRGERGGFTKFIVWDGNR